MFEDLFNIFAPKGIVRETEPNVFECEKGTYSVILKFDRRQCNVKSGNIVLFEMRAPNGKSKMYRIYSIGKNIMSLQLDENLYSLVKDNLVYKENWRMKHSVVLPKKEMLDFCRAFLTMDKSYDNGLIKIGDQLDNSKNNRYNGRNSPAGIEVPTKPKDVLHINGRVYFICANCGERFIMANRCTICGQLQDYSE